MVSGFNIKSGAKRSTKWRLPIDLTEAPDDEFGPLQAFRQDEAFGNSDAGR